MRTKPDVFTSNREEFCFETRIFQHVQSFSQNVLSRLLSWAPTYTNYHTASSRFYNYYKSIKVAEAEARASHKLQAAKLQKIVKAF
jgi:hypothetical protein